MASTTTTWTLSGINFGITFLGTISSVLVVATLRRNMAKNIDIMLHKGISFRDFYDLASLQTGHYVSPLKSATSAKFWAALLLFTGILTSSMVSIMSPKTSLVTIGPQSVSDTVYCDGDTPWIPSLVFPPLEDQSLSCIQNGTFCPKAAGRVIADFLTTLTTSSSTRRYFLTGSVYQPTNYLISDTLSQLSGECRGLTPCRCTNGSNGINEYGAQALGTNIQTIVRGANHLTADAVRFTDARLTTSQISVATGKYKFTLCSDVNLNPGQLELAYCHQKNVDGSDMYQFAVINGGPGSDSATLFNQLLGTNLHGWQAIEFSFKLRWHYNSTIILAPGFGALLSGVNNTHSVSPGAVSATYFSQTTLNSTFHEWVIMNAENGTLLTHELAKAYNLSDPYLKLPEGFDDTTDTLLTYILEAFINHNVVAFLSYYNDGVSALETDLTEFNVIYLLGPKSKLGLALIAIPAIILLSVIITYGMAARGTVAHIDLGDPLSLLLGTNNQTMTTLTQDHGCPKRFIETHGNTVIRACQGEKPGISVVPVLFAPAYQYRDDSDNGK